MESSRTVIVVFVLAAGGAGFLLWRANRPAAPELRPPTPIVRPTTPPAPPPPPAPPKPAIEHPLADEAPGPALPDSNASDAFFKKALSDLLGNKAVTSFLMLDGFARRVVATVNNLDGDTAASDLWPVTRTPGRFEVGGETTGTSIARGNSDRYVAFVRFVEAIDTERAVALYRRAYPLLQKAYEDLGAPGQYFNDRVVKVIDHLLATPDLEGPIRVKRAGADGGAPLGATGSLFLFEDPALESRSSGQKILLRMGHDHAIKVKAKLRDVRRLIARAP